VKHRKFFHFEWFAKWSNTVKHAYYNWENEQYQTFMVFLLSNLEVIKVRKGQILIGEMDTVETLYFMADASIDLGYEINRSKKFVVRLSGNIMIGGYELSFNQRA